MTKIMDEAEAKKMTKHVVRMYNILKNKKTLR